MQVHTQELADVTRYIQNNAHLRLEDHQQQYEQYLRLIGRHLAITPATRMLEIGTGTGWFPLMCKLNGLNCKGLEISPQLVEYAKQFGRAYGIEPDIELGNIEEAEIGDNDYDAIVAFSVFEHIEKWRLALDRIYRALRPGGVFMFGSTNKFGPSNEFDFPLYGWLPNSWRYRLRIHYQGPDIMKLGIDFHQFTYPGLRRAFRETGFRQIYDRVQIADPNRISHPVKRYGLLACKHLPPLKHLALTFIQGTDFVCVK